MKSTSKKSTSQPIGKKTKPSPREKDQAYRAAHFGLNYGRGPEAVAAALNRAPEPNKKQIKAMHAQIGYPVTDPKRLGETKPSPKAAPKAKATEAFKIETEIHVLMLSTIDGGGITSPAFIKIEAVSFEKAKLEKMGKRLRKRKDVFAYNVVTLNLI